jgi:hypothetical protein
MQQSNRQIEIDLSLFGAGDREVDHAQGVRSAFVCLARRTVRSAQEEEHRQGERSV